MPHQSLYQAVFNHGNQGNDVVKELEEAAREFPYFSLAHFFLLKNIPPGHPDEEAIAAMTALHFSNPYLLNQQLKKESSGPSFDKIAPVEIAEEEALSEIYVQPAEEPATTPVVEETVENITQALPVEEKKITEIEPVAAAEILVAEPVTESRPATEILFEPLHTTDYFASQGIKLSEEAQPTDKLGKQLKSFTEWLKTMKKVHESKLPEGNEQLDASVNKLAEKSNKDEEVLTEAMAEAYIIQGKPGKAKDIYLKLSLLNPSKNAYFAAKIDQIAW